MVRGLSLQYYLAVCNALCHAIPGILAVVHACCSWTAACSDVVDWVMSTRKQAAQITCAADAGCKLLMLASAGSPPATDGMPALIPQQGMPGHALSYKNIVNGSCRNCRKHALAILVQLASAASMTLEAPSHAVSSDLYQVCAARERCPTVAPRSLPSIGRACTWRQHWLTASSPRSK